MYKYENMKNHGDKKVINYLMIQSQCTLNARHRIYPKILYFKSHG